MMNLSTLENLITDALEWVRVNCPEQYPQMFLQLVPVRCEIRNMNRAQEENPAIAAYGESQKGKSYLIGNLLQKNGDPFLIRCGGESYNFLSEINPIGDNREATGVVTRFTSYKAEGKASLASDLYPARMKVMSIAHVVTILVDGYFSDLLDDNVFDSDEIRRRAEELVRTYSGKPEAQKQLTEDDIIDIKLYMLSNLSQAKVGVFCTHYFDQVAMVIRNIPQSEWENVFKVLWYDNPEITALFRRLLACIQKLKFAPVVYLPICALLHHGDNRNTIMSVQCLNGLYSVEDESQRRLTSVFVKQVDESFVEFPEIDMSELSALCLEIIFKVDSEFLDNNAQFSFYPDKAGQPGYMSREVYDKLTRSGNPVSKMKLLEYSDLMDFPGAKNRERIRTANLTNLDPETQQSNLVKMYLRGKVSFLFNHFSNSRALNVLLFCHNADDVKVTQMYDTIDKWINAYVGDTPEKRRKTVEDAGGVSPFFAIGTMFNKDMTQKSSAAANTPKALENRWKGRFSTVMYQDCFHAGDVGWFKDWVGKDESFKSIYILRDYKYSGCDGEGNNLFKGYNPNVRHSQETDLAMSPEFYGQMTESFINDRKNVVRFFDDPRVVWEATATLNNDGSLYIIKQLCTVAEHLFAVRKSQFEIRSGEVCRKVVDLIHHFHKTNDSEAKLKEHIRRSFDVLSEFDTSSHANDNSFFGRLIELLQVSDDEAYDVVHDIVESPDLVTKVISFPNVEAIWRRIKVDSPFESEAQVLESIRRIYGFPDIKAVSEYLLKKHIDPKHFLVSSRHPQRKNSYVIAEALVEFWRKKISSSSFLSKTTEGTPFDMGIMSDLINNLLEMIDVACLTEKMSDTVAELTNVVSVGTINQFLVTDILRHMLNTFVTDLGISLLAPDKVKELKLVAESQATRFPISGSTESVPQSEFSEEELTEMFAGVLAKSETPSYWRHYNAWLENMYFSYLATAGQITIIENPAANEAIGQIISDLNAAV